MCDGSFAFPERLQVMLSPRRRLTSCERERRRTWSSCRYTLRRTCCRTVGCGRPRCPSSSRTCAATAPATAVLLWVQASVGTHKTGIRQVKSGNPDTFFQRASTLSSAAFEHSLQISHRHYLEKCVPLWQSQQSLIRSDFLYRHDIIILSRLGQQFIRWMWFHPHYRQA